MPRQGTVSQCFNSDRFNIASSNNNHSLFPDGPTAVFSPVTSQFRAGNLGNRVNEWGKITSDLFILEAVKGYRIDFLCDPVQPKPRVTRPVGSDQEALISQEVQELLSKNAIEEVVYHPQEFISNIFLVPKKNGKMRPVINLKGEGPRKSASGSNTTYAVDSSSVGRAVLVPRSANDADLSTGAVTKETQSSCLISQRRASSS